ncbi:general secretion pathway protein GspL [Pseudomonas veronii]|jgi:general secretion pathway protein L|uniref:General secretion pathway protein GspL n=1 Tax=Pseudomonas veronii TaxID=76761 RepID=A0A7Y0ZYI1_PSEVE|nr:MULTISPECIES: type II secretion system protein GspL [Pseudomonas]SEC96474.1 general secretion pathway protein L [Pseudomonas marginalis]KRP68802.1 general secretion pathway protein GspL [Pseudomonas veronii]MCT8965155.1 type II secretion system protein GspL [Pseudomonas veronii]NMX51568.1 general secretion pathway protein GspL [Pseudomonas veronii]NMY00332.1 general secretion pathway protein GspL [Pseudomonas veronii]
MNRLEPIARYWRGSLLQQGWRLWLTELRVCVPAWLALREPPEQRWHWPLSEPVASAPGNARHVLVLAADAVLLQTIHLPVAAARNLSAVVGYELDRYTPFEADRLYFVARQERRTPTQLQVTLVAILRERLDQILSDCAALGLQPHRVDVGDLGIDLLPAPLRPRPRPPGKGLQRSLPWLCGALLIAAMLLWLNDRQRVLDTMYDSVQQQKAQVAEVHALRQQLLATRGAVQYLTRRKVAQPPLVALLDDLTRCLPADTWLDQLDIKGSEIAFSGQSAKASALITRIKGCHRLDNAQFEGVIQPDARSGKDQFALRAHLRPEAADAPTPHTP